MAPFLSKQFPLSHFDLLDEPVCHVGCAQFERQWPPENLEPLSHPISKSLQWLNLWHVPSSHEVWIEPQDVEKAENWLKSHKTLLSKSVQIRNSLNPPKFPLFFWGNSPKALEWAQKKGFQTSPTCELSITQKVHNKTWLEQERKKPLLEDRSTEILDSYESLEKLVTCSNGKGWMFKKPWSAAGTGNKLYLGKGTIPNILRKWIENEGHLIAQPLLDKKIDFSSLWYLKPRSEAPIFLGSTRMVIDATCRYMGCYIPQNGLSLTESENLWQDHLEETRALLKRMTQAGYFGYVGFDGLVYQTNSGLQQAVIEINARQTLAMHLVSVSRNLNYLPAKALLRKSGSLEKGTFSLIPPNQGLLQIELQALP